jgi:hypothetical protein
MTIARLPASNRQVRDLATPGLTVGVGSPNRPALTNLKVDGWVVCDCGDLDRAGDWLSCRNGAYCRNAAYLTPVYSSLERALEATSARAEKWAEAILPGQPGRLTQVDPLRLTVRRLEVPCFRGRDYRERPCGLMDAIGELRNGDGREAAWREILEQRDQDQIEGALLAGGYGTRGNLFLFRSARKRVTVLSIAKEFEWQDPRHRDDGDPA